MHLRDDNMVMDISSKVHHLCTLHMHDQSCTECMLHCLFVLPLGRLQSGLHFKYCAANPLNISSKYSPLAVGGLTCLKNFLRIRHQKYFTYRTAIDA